MTLAPGSNTVKQFSYVLHGMPKRACQMYGTANGIPRYKSLGPMKATHLFVLTHDNMALQVGKLATTTELMT